MRRLLEPILKIWRDRVRGPVLRSYDAAREELGGVPWRAFASTERWFLASPPPPIPGGSDDEEPRPVTLDTAALKIDRPSLRELLQGKGRWVAGGSALVVILLCTVALSGRSRAMPPPPVAAVALAPSVIPAPAPTAVPAVVLVAPAPRAARVRPASSLSPSLQSLLSGKSGSKPSKAVSRSRGKKRRR